MNLEPITVNYSNCILLGVPSIHFNHIFANEVNRICSNPATRPEAIVVELGAQGAAAALNWLKELGVGHKRRKPLPVMMGLAKRNQVIRSSFMEKAIRLQEETGRDLSELPPEVLYGELEFGDCNLLCLSPTDSIIESLRCAIELNLPLYGVDLEETPPGKYDPIIIQDPMAANGNLIAYIAQNAPYAASHRDEEIETRREIAMAARLKALIGKYHRVLFTCGMAHWLPIQKHLEDPSLRPSLLPQVSTGKEGDFMRVIVHPLIAIYHMDLFPALVGEYEKSRRPSYEFNNPGNENGSIDAGKIFEELLRKTYLRYFCRWRKRKNDGQRFRDLERHRHFESYLGNLCLLNHCLVPDLVLTIKAAQEMMSKGFVKALSATFLRFPWVPPDQYPDCSLLVQISNQVNGSLCARFLKKGIPQGKHFYLRPLPGNSPYPVVLEISYKWKRDPQTSEGDGVLHTWTPWDFLISSMSFRAIHQARWKGYEKKTEPFEGSLLEGIDIKSTLRAYARGEDILYVFDRSKKYLPPESYPGDGFPVVWILDPGEHRGAKWNALYEDCDWMRKHVQDLESLDQLREKLGHKMIALIGYGDIHAKTPVSDRHLGIQSDRYYGIVIYQPICWTKRQFAHWVEVMGYRRNPFCDRSELGVGGLSDLTAHFEKEHSIKIGEFDWVTTLMLFAIPFAKDRVTVVIPSNYQIHPIVFERAKRYGIEVSIAPLALFTQKERERVSLNHMAPALTMDPECIFSKSIEEGIGESQTMNRDLVPQSWIDFGKEQT